MIFRNARQNEADVLTRLTLASKRHWGYPEEWMKIWEDELTIRPAYIAENMVVVAEEDAELLGYISIRKRGDQGFFLDNLFIRPSHMRKGIGEKLLAIALDWCRQRRIAQLNVCSDPFSKGFYEKTGAAYIREIPSEAIPGRTLPFFT
ncbi:MAG: GNAT family N-acetyltransferase, partial [Clostridiales bacterium]|nr:GNAT family N-acetyltransferase [Clostridiales bacterium]